MAELLVADFGDVEAGRAAVIELERRGVIDADRVQLRGPADPLAEGNRRRADRRTGQLLVRRALVGGLIGAILGAALGAVATVVLGMDSQPTPALGAALGVGVFAGALGAYYAVGSGLPVTEGAVDAVDDPGVGGVQVLVDLDERVREADVRPHLEGCGARRVERVRR